MSANRGCRKELRPKYRWSLHLLRTSPSARQLQFRGEAVNLSRWFGRDLTSLAGGHEPIADQAVDAYHDSQVGTLSTGSGVDPPPTRYTSLSEAGGLDAIVVGSGFGGAVAGARLA